MALACIVATQKRLDELTPYDNLRQPTGALNAILSPQNKSEAKAKFLTDDGKTKKYNLTYVPRNCPTPVNCPADMCAAGVAAPTLTTTELTITKCKALPVFECTDTQFRDLCNFSTNMYFAKLVQGQMDALVRAINVDVLTKICANIGCFGAVTATTEKALTLLDATTGAPKWTVDVDIMEEFQNNGIMETPLLIGNNVLTKFAKGYNNGLGTDSGVNMGSMTNFPAFYDNQLQTVCPPASLSTMIAVAPQVVHFFNYLNNAGDFQSNLNIEDGNFDPTSMMREKETFTFGVLQDPKTGLMFDFDAIFEPCNRKWKFKISINYDTWVMPVITCTSNTAGTNSCFTGIQKFRVS